MIYIYNTIKKVVPYRLINIVTISYRLLYLFTIICVIILFIIRISCDDLKVLLGLTNYKIYLMFFVKYDGPYILNRYDIRSIIGISKTSNEKIIIG